MFSLKVCALALALVTVQASPLTSKNDPTKSPSSSKQLPLQETDVQQVPDPEGRESKPPSLQWMKNNRPETLHNLSKRFIPSGLLNEWASPLKQSSVFQDAKLGSRPFASNNIQPSTVDTVANYMVGNHDIIDTSGYDPDFLDYVRELTISKRFLDLLPAKVPRRKDLPPRLGEETAPKFVRTFNPASYTKRRPYHPLRGLFNDSPSSDGDILNPAAGIPIGLANNRFWGQTFHIDNPIINNLLKVDIKGNEIFSSSEYYDDYFDDARDESESMGDEESDEEEEDSEGAIEESTLASKQLQRQRHLFTAHFKEIMVRLLSKLHSEQLQ